MGKRRQEGRHEQKIISFVVGALLFALCVSVEAQQQEKVPRIGYLSTDSTRKENVEGLRLGLRELGYVEGKTIAIEYRYADGVDRLPDLAAELVRFKVDVIVVTRSTTAAIAAKHATNTIPIIIAGLSDPVETGLVASLAHPGANITGLTIMNAELAGKRLELLKETTPKLFRVAVLWNRTNSGAALVFKQTKSATQELGLELQSLEVKSVTDLDSALKAATRSGANALVLLATAPIGAHLKQIADFAIKSRLPSIYDRSFFPEVGGLMSYGANIVDVFRRAATYINKILKGAKPSDLPIEQPTKFELVINLKTAKQIGLTIPQSVLFRADKVIK